jgi:hypothetical protein
VRNILATDNTTSFPIRTTLQKRQEESLMKNFTSIESNSYKENDVRVIIKQWPLSIDQRNLETLDNLLVYKWYIVPRSIKITLTNDLKSLRYFSNSWYDITYLDLYLKNFILNSDKNQNIINTTNTLLPLQTSFAQQFSIQCLLSPTLTDFFCQKALQEITSVLPLYDLKQDYIWLTQVSQAIQWTSYAPMFCESIKKYIFFSNDSSKEIKDIMVACGKQYELSIADFISFRSIQEQLNKESINATVTPSTLLNIYKLISTQNTIYYDIMIWKNINTNRINGYNNYVEALLKEPDALQAFYFDVIVRYNNTFLIPELMKASLATRGDVVDDYKKTLEKLKKLNQWDSIARHKWLIAYINNKSLLDTIVTDTNSWTNIISLIDNFTKNYNFSNFIIQSTAENNNQTLISTGILRFDQATIQWLANNTPMSAVFTIKDQKILVQSIDLPRQKNIAIVINKKLSLQPLTINEVYTLIIENSMLKDTQTVCVFFKEHTNIIDCTNKKISINQKNINYTFYYTEEKWVENYTISNILLEKSAKSLYGKTINITKKPIEAINVILQYNWETAQEPTIIKNEIQQTGWLQEVEIQKYFWSISDNIKEIIPNWKTLVIKFNLKAYEYIAIYDNKTKYILWLGIIVGKTTYPIRNFTFSFLTAKQEDITLFKNDPASFLLQKDPLTVKKLQLK